MHDPIKGKVVVITGASRGIGRAAAVRLAESGARVALLGREEAALAQAAAAAKAKGAEVRTYTLDLRDDLAVTRTSHAILSDFGTVDALVNNAAVGVYGSFLDLTLDDWRLQVGVNIVGLVAITKALLPTMLEKKSGYVLNIASIQGLRTSPTSSAYSATKFALMGITDSLSQECLPKGVRVSVLCPGSVDTGFAGKPGGDELALTPDDVALSIREMLETGGKAWATQTVLLPFLRS